MGARIPNIQILNTFEMQMVFCLFLMLALLRSALFFDHLKSIFRTHKYKNYNNFIIPPRGFDPWSLSTVVKLLANKSTKEIWIFWVWLWKFHQDLSYSYVQNQPFGNGTSAYKYDMVPKSPKQLKSEPFNIWRTFHHSKPECVW